MHSSRMRTVRNSSRLRGVYLVPAGDVWGAGGVPGPGEGVYLVGGGTCPGTPTPPCGQTHTCKNITFATSLRTVKINIKKFKKRPNGGSRDIVITFELALALKCDAE